MYLQIGFHAIRLQGNLQETSKSSRLIGTLPIEHLKESNVGIKW